MNFSQDIVLDGRLLEPETEVGIGSGSKFMVGQKSDFLLNNQTCVRMLANDIFAFCTRGNWDI